MFAHVLNGEFPARHQIHPSWQRYLKTNEFGVYDHILPCISSEHESEVDLTLPMSKHELRLDQIDGDGGTIINMITSPTVLHGTYPIVASFVAQRFSVCPAFGLSMKQATFVFYTPHASWSDMVKFRIHALARLMTGGGSSRPSFARRPAELSADPHAVGYMLYFSKVNIIFNTNTGLFERLETDLFPNVELGDIRLREDVHMLKNRHAKLQRRIEAELLRATGMVTITDFSKNRREVEAEEAERVARRAERQEQEAREREESRKRKRRAAKDLAIIKGAALQQQGTRRLKKKTRTAENGQKEMCCLCWDEVGSSSSSSSGSAFVRCSNPPCSKAYCLTCVWEWADKAESRVKTLWDDGSISLACSVCTLADKVVVLPTRPVMEAEEAGALL